MTTMHRRLAPPFRPYCCLLADWEGYSYPRHTEETTNA